MAPTIVLLLPLFLSLTSASLGPAHSPSQSPAMFPTSLNTTPGPSLIDQTCHLTNHVQDCIRALNVEPLAHKSQPKQLAAIALRLAQQNGTETAGYIRGLLDQTEAEPNTQQCLTDCVEDYELALDELDDATAALDVNVLDNHAHSNAITWISTAMDHVKNCQGGCKEGAEHKNVMTKRNAAFERLCSISISIIKHLH